MDNKEIQKRLDGIVELEAKEPIEYWTEDANDNCLELSLIKDASGNVSGVIIVSGTGGPHIELNTRDKRVYGWWGNCESEAYVLPETCYAINDYYSEIF